MKKLTTLLLALLMICSVFLTACGNPEENVENTEPVVEKTEILIYDGRKSDYKIVIPEDATEYEEFASSELVLFFEQATGVELEVITDKGLTFSENDKYFSLGRTTLLAGSGVTISYDELGNDGYKIVRKGNTLIMCGGSGFGTVYSVYGFLKKTVNYRALAPDEIIVDTAYKLYLLDFDWTDVPALAYRTGGHYVTMQSNTEFAMRSRTYAGHGYSMFQSDIWGLWSHTHFPLLPVATYKAAHPDWYSPDGTQLCLSNMEMRAEMVEVLKRLILSDTTEQLYMVGQQDTPTFCNCEACTYNVEAIGSNSALMMDFINDIAEDIEEWAKTACPDRHILIGTFAYQRTEGAPVKKNEEGVYELCTLPTVLKNSVRDENGEIQDRTVTNTSVKARDNVFVMIAPIYADWSEPINDPDYNTNYKAILEGWSIAADKIALWTYCNNFSMRLEYFDNFNTIATNYQIYEDLGAFYVYDESGQTAKANMMFQALSRYIISNISWDNDLNVENLIDEFIDGYYKEAAEPIKELFDLFRNYFRTRKAELGGTDSHIGTGIWLGDASQAELKKSFWNIGVLEQMLALIDEAHAKIDAAVYSEEDRETMHLRITQESLTPRMYLLQLFSAEIESSEYFKMIDEFEADMASIGVDLIFSGKTLAQTTAEWRANKM